MFVGLVKVRTRLILVVLAKVNIGSCKQGYYKVKVGQCKSVNGIETGVWLPSKVKPLVELSLTGISVPWSLIADMVAWIS